MWRHSYKYLSTLVPYFRSTDVLNLSPPPQFWENIPLASPFAVVSLAPFSSSKQFTHHFKSCLTDAHQYKAYAEPAISHDSQHVSLVQWTDLFTSRHKGHRFKSPGGVLMWNRDSPVNVVSLQADCFGLIRDPQYMASCLIQLQTGWHPTMTSPCCS